MRGLLSVLQCIAMHCSVLQCITAHCSVLQCNAMHCSVLQRIAVHCSVLQCIAVHWHTLNEIKKKSNYLWTRRYQNFCIDSLAQISHSDRLMTGRLKYEKCGKNRRMYILVCVCICVCIYAHVYISAVNFLVTELDVARRFCHKIKP